MLVTIYLRVVGATALYIPGLESISIFQDLVFFIPGFLQPLLGFLFSLCTQNGGIIPFFLSFHLPTRADICRILTLFRQRSGWTRLLSSSIALGLFPSCLGLVFED